jgi:hypothetical protein
MTDIGELRSAITSLLADAGAEEEILLATAPAGRLWPPGLLGRDPGHRA